MDKLGAMQAFVRVVESGTFTRAADSLGLPKATVTRLVQTLEASLQTKLLNRTTRRVTVTVDGAAYFDRALRLLSEMQELEASMTGAKANPRGRLRIDVGSAIGQLLLIPALPDFHARYPDIQIDLGISDRVVDLIGENVDCVLRAGEISDQSLVARRIGEFHTILCATPAYLQQHGLPRHPDALQDSQHRMVSYLSERTGRPYPMNFRNKDEHIEVSPRYTLAVNDSSAALVAGLAGLGIVQTATFMAEPHLARGALVPLLLDWCAESVPLYVVYPPNRHLSAKLRVFVDWVAELFARSDMILRKCCLPKPAAALEPRPALPPGRPLPDLMPTLQAAAAAAAAPATRLCPPESLPA